MYLETVIGDRGVIDLQFRIAAQKPTLHKHNTSTNHAVSFGLQCCHFFIDEEKLRDLSSESKTTATVKFLILSRSSCQHGKGGSIPDLRSGETQFRVGND